MADTGHSIVDITLCLSWLVEGVQMGRSLYLVVPYWGMRYLCFLKRARQIGRSIGSVAWSYVSTDRSCAGSALAKIERRGGQFSVYWITSSALAISVGGTSRPSALAVFILITNATFVDCSTGRRAGFLPLRMRST